MYLEKNYKGFLSQSGGSPVTMDGLNTSDSQFLGDVSWTVDEEGIITGTKENAFPENKTFCQLGSTFHALDGYWSIECTSVSTVQIYCTDAPAGNYIKRDCAKLAVMITVLP